jgi:hypothetical protein
MTDSHLMAIVTYALTVAGSHLRTNAFLRMEAMKKIGKETTRGTYNAQPSITHATFLFQTGTGVYWSERPIPPNPIRIIDTVPYNLPRALYPQEAKAVEATSYALMVYLHLNRVSESLPIMKWLQTMRNSVGGFSGTRVSWPCTCTCDIHLIALIARIPPSPHKPWRSTPREMLIGISITSDWRLR